MASNISIPHVMEDVEYGENTSQSPKRINSVDFSIKIKTEINLD